MPNPHTEPLDAATLAAIQARCEAATPGPWRSRVHTKDNTPHLEEGQYSASVFPPDRFSWFADCARGGDPEVARRNAEFIAHARRDIPRLLNHLDLMQEAMRRLVEALADVSEECEAVAGNESATDKERRVWNAKATKGFAALEAARPFVTVGEEET